MRIQALFLAVTGALALSACGSSEEPPVEQIVVREPGEAPAEPQEPADLVAAGKAAFATCMGCHSAERDGGSGVGPNLFGVVGRSAGSLEDFAYSDALAASGIVWDAAELDSFLADPTGKVSGTTMVAGAVSDADQRVAIIAYLASLTD